MTYSLSLALPHFINFKSEIPSKADFNFQIKLDYLCPESTSNFIYSSPPSTPQKTNAFYWDFSNLQIQCPALLRLSKKSKPPNVKELKMIFETLSDNSLKIY